MVTSNFCAKDIAIRLRESLTPDEKTTTRLMEKALTQLGPPVIIGHACGYKDNAGKIYSEEATANCKKHANYLEIDVVKRNGEWYYFHEGRFGEGDRRRGIILEDFLKEFKMHEGR